MDKEKLAKLRDYYKDNLTIIGFNDLEVVNNASSFFKRDLLDYLSYFLSTDELKTIVVDAFSKIVNKTEYINYYLKSNLSIEEIKLSNVYSTVLSLEKFMINKGLPKSLGKIGYLSTFRNLINRDDDSTYITSLLEEASNPLIIYSSGYNDLKSEIALDGVNSPINLDYTLRQVKSKKTLSKVMVGVERNFYNILSINDKSDIYVINAFIPKTIEEVKNLVINFNESLYDLCTKYNLTYVDRNVTDGSILSLCEEIVSAIYINKFITERKQVREYSDYSYNYKGTFGVMERVFRDFKDKESLAMMRDELEKEILLRNANLDKDVYDVFDKVQKVLTKRKKKYSPRVV